jgi:hypothetical protein
MASTVHDSESVRVKINKVSKICSFSGTGDDFREEGLFGFQTHGLTWSTYSAFIHYNKGKPYEIRKAPL